MGTHFFLSLSSQLPFLLAAALSIILYEWGIPKASPQLQKIPNRQKQVQAKIREPHNGADRRAALSGWMDGAPRLPHFHQPHLSRLREQKALVALRHLREEEITS